MLSHELLTQCRATLHGTGRVADHPWHEAPGAPARVTASPGLQLPTYRMTILKALAVSGLSLALMAQAKAPDALVQARESYNNQRYDDAIRLAQDARATPALEPGANVVLARALLERFRQTGQASDVDLARAVLKAIDVEALSARDRVELAIALGTSLYLDESYDFDDRFSAAAEQFELALAHASLLDPRSRDQLFDWWAGSLDRQAQQGSEAARRVVYERILARAEQEVAHDGYSAAAAYWLAASARGVGDLTRAMGAAVAGWVRAASLGPRGDSLRLDLDRLIQQVILPERAREMVPNGDPHPTLALLQQQWQQLREKWEP